MDLDKVEKLLQKYNIETVEELEYYLNIDNKTDECMEDKEGEEKNCINSKCYEDIFVPDCRKLIEVYHKYFKQNIKSKKLFVQYLVAHTNKSPSSIENYLSCKSCNQQIVKSINNSLKISDSDFKKDFCFNLEIKFNYMSLFERDYTSINQFLAKEHKVTKENFKSYSTAHDTLLTKAEEEKLFELTHVSKQRLKLNLDNPKNREGSKQYQMNLALALFNRNLIEESDEMIVSLSKAKDFKVDKAFLQLKAKILSSQAKDNEAINVLHELVEMIKPNIDAETNNLLNASIKREAFKAFKLYGDEARLKEQLSIAKEGYFLVYKLNNDYYPALNYIYLESILAYINGSDLEALQRTYRDIWSKLEYRIDDWWSYIASVEYLILLGRYEEAIERLKLHFDIQ